MRSATGPVERALLYYIEDCYMRETPLSGQRVRELLARAAPGSLNYSVRSDDGTPLLHLAVMNEVSEPAELEAVISALVAHGFSPADRDEDGDTALEAIMALSEEDPTSDDTSGSELAKRAHVAAVAALLRSPGQEVDQMRVAAICGWLRRHGPAGGYAEALSALERRVGADIVARAWASEGLLAYLERRTYEERRALEVDVVRHFISMGASPGHALNGATSLLLVVLNPYCPIEDLTQIFRLMLMADPGVAAVRDGFKLSPLQWAADYVNVASQHGVSPPNPSALLALLPAIMELAPRELDTGVACFKASPEGGFSAGASASSPAVCRFLEGDRVLCRVEAPGGVCSWEEGVVIGLWYTERCWPASHPGAPYEVLLDIGSRVFALVDDDRIICREVPKQLRATAGQSVRPTVPPATPGQRFQRRERGDGTWELIDTVSGKARPCSPPGSDEED